MCGIIGFSGWNAGSLPCAFQKIAHRGLDDSGLLFLSNNADWAWTQPVVHPGPLGQKTHS